MSKPELEFTPHAKFERTKYTSVPGLYERIIAKDPNSDAYTRILEFEPGTDTTPNGPQVHDFWEELYIIEGSIIDVSLNQEFSAGDVACRPPGMVHGPWKSPNGCKIFEVRYYANKS